MALHFMEAIDDLWTVKAKKSGNSPEFLTYGKQLLQTYLQQWISAREQVLSAVGDMEVFIVSQTPEASLTGHKTYQQLAAVLSLAAQNQVKLCRELVNGLYPFTGMAGADRHSEINKVWRDFQTGSQHALFVPGAANFKLE